MCSAQTPPQSSMHRKGSATDPAVSDRPPPGATVQGAADSPAAVEKRNLLMAEVDSPRYSSGLARNGNRPMPYLLICRTPVDWLVESSLTGHVRRQMVFWFKRHWTPYQTAPVSNGSASQHQWYLKSILPELLEQFDTKISVFETAVNISVRCPRTSVQGIQSTNNVCISCSCAARI